MKKFADLLKANMFLQLNHQKLLVYSHARQLIRACYRITNQFPGEEKYSLVQQIRRASVSVLLNIAEGSSRTSVAERRRFFEIARGSVIEIDAALEISQDIGYLRDMDLNDLDQEIKTTFKFLSLLIKN